MSPEQFERKSFDHKVDVFAFGTLLWELYSEEVPYEGFEAHDIKEMVLEGKGLNFKSSIPASIAAIVKSCRDYNPKNRPEMSKVIQLLRKV